MQFTMKYDPVKDSWFVNYRIVKPKKKSFKVSKYIDKENARMTALYWLDEMVERSGRIILGMIVDDGNVTYRLA